MDGVTRSSLASGKSCSQNIAADAFAVGVVIVAELPVISRSLDDVFVLRYSCESFGEAVLPGLLLGIKHNAVGCCVEKGCSASSVLGCAQQQSLGDDCGRRTAP